MATSQCFVTLREYLADLREHFLQLEKLLLGSLVPLKAPQNLLFSSLSNFSFIQVHPWDTSVSPTSLWWPWSSQKLPIYPGPDPWRFQEQSTVCAQPRGSPGCVGRRIWAVPTPELRHWAAGRWNSCQALGINTRMGLNPTLTASALHWACLDIPHEIGYETEIWLWNSTPPWCNTCTSFIARDSPTFFLLNGRFLFSSSYTSTTHCKKGRRSTGTPLGPGFISGINFLPWCLQRFLSDPFSGACFAFFPAWLSKRSKGNNLEKNNEHK